MSTARSGGLCRRANGFAVRPGTLWAETWGIDARSEGPLPAVDDLLDAFA
ncbi:hypothetical protein [Kutzneria buriramensis]|uniref:Uncharacterized protein n=1 Tax=Kutzneria buriramensis TaxID=1045776 RepID=A0A3E0G3Z6_9PSEU|nr:hypothetical protein [Kutzneria buriramensis]REH17465.1 hypothetical protein BCF44_1458 [Kutzneria buriramensis]